MNKTIFNDKLHTFGIIIIILICGGMYACNLMQDSSDEEIEEISNSILKRYKPRSDLPIIRLAITGRRNSIREIYKYTGIMREFEKNGLTLQIITVAKYSDILDKLKKGEVEMAKIPTADYPFYYSRVPIEALVKPSINGKTSFQCFIVVNKNSEFSILKHLKAKASHSTFAFHSPGSTPGHLVPMAMLKEIGIDPEKDFKRTYFTYSMKIAFRDVIRGKCDAISCSDNQYKRESNNIKSQLRIIAVSDPIPQNPYVIRLDLSEELRQKVCDILINMINTSSGKSALALRGKDYEKPEKFKYVKADDNDYNIVREMLTQVWGYQGLDKPALLDTLSLSDTLNTDGEVLNHTE